MIKLQSRGGREHLIVAVFACNICGQAIADVGDGVVVFRGTHTGENELLDLMHVHKGRCHDRADMIVVGTGHAPWFELADHVNGLVKGLGLTIQEMMNREADWSCALTPSDHTEL